MKLSFEQSLQAGVTVLIVGLMFFCMIFDRELYPFAPYTMYSYKHELLKHEFYKLFCLVGGSEITITNDMMNPMDEARLKTSISVDYINKDWSIIPSKLGSIQERILLNGNRCDSVILRLSTYASLKDYLANKEQVINQFTTVKQ